MLERNLARGGDEAEACAPPVSRTSRRREDQPENILERQIKDFLAWRGFINIRQHVGTFLPLRVAKQLQAGQITFEQALRNVVRIGEEGCADWWSARPIIPPGGCAGRTSSMGSLFLGGECARQASHRRAARMA
jgi:hypothetical protein